MLPKEKQLIQELLSHPGWEVFKSLILIDANDRRSLKTQLQADLMSAGRAGEPIKAASATGALDILNVLLDVPVKYLKGG